MSAYLKAAGIAVRPARGRRLAAKPASQVTTDSKPASGVTTDPSAAGQLLSGWPPRTTKTRQASLCEPGREFIADAVDKGRNATAIYQDLVTYHGL